MGIRAVVVNRAICVRERYCAPVRSAMLAVSFILLGLLTLRPFCVPVVATGFGGSHSPVDMVSWVVPGGDRGALREKGPCSLGFKPGAVLTTAQFKGSVMSQVADFVPLALALDGAQSVGRSRAAAKGFPAHPPQLTYYARSARILR